MSDTDVSLFSSIFYDPFKFPGKRSKRFFYTTVVLMFFGVIFLTTFLPSIKDVGFKWGVGCGGFVLLAACAFTSQKKLRKIMSEESSQNKKSHEQGNI